MERALLTGGERDARDSVFRMVSPADSIPDIIALLIFSVLTIAAFFFWEHHVIHRTSRPPLIRLKLFTRSKGRLAAVYFIGFTAWMGFVVSHSILDA